MMAKKPEFKRTYIIGPDGKPKELVHHPGEKESPEFVKAIFVVVAIFALMAALFYLLVELGVRI
ncbi:hypothetical protein ACFL3C_01525 [Patescibacteria group bacterium]